MSNRDQATSLIDRGWRGYWENPLEYDPASASIPSDPRGIPPLPPYTYQPRPAPQSLLMRPPASMAYAPSFLPYTTANPYYSSSSYPAQTVPLNVFEATSGQSEPARVYYPPGEPPLLNQYYTTHPHNPHFHDEYLPRPMITVPSSAHIPPHPIYQYPRPMHTTGMPQEMRPSSSGFQHPTFITPPENEFVAKASYPVFSPSAMPLIEAQNHPPISSWPSTPPILAPNFNAAESYPRPHDTQESRSSMVCVVGDMLLPGRVGRGSLENKLVINVCIGIYVNKAYLYTLTNTDPRALPTNKTDS
ncbi:hypothetical protein DFS34DRAFT_250732 [Phlyctochytrium arcticum]|nr:hypothetical protein DFS34DRAFT_250732 [Phlyctochytrium arcticum]